MVVLFVVSMGIRLPGLHHPLFRIACGLDPLRPVARCLCAGVGVVVRVLMGILAGRECACVCVLMEVF